MIDVVINANKIDDVTSCSAAPYVFYEHILTCIGYQTDLPVADLLRRYHQLSGKWVLASPIHWSASHNDATLNGQASTLLLSDDESRLWFNQLCQFMQQAGINMHYHDAYTWLIQIEQAPNLTARSPSLLLNQSLKRELMSMDDTNFWQKWLTEIQMYFSSHPLNQKRTHTCDINGVWFWGAGRVEQSNRPLVCDQSLFELATHLSSDVRLYEENRALPKHAMVIFNDMSKEKYTAFTRQLRKKTTRWSWNNAIEVDDVMPLFKRIWRGFNHAH